MYRMSFAMFAGLALLSTSAMSAPTTINLCTGAADGVYDSVGKMIQDKLRGDPNVNIRIVADTGGTWGNIQLSTNVEGPTPTEEDYTAGKACHAFIGQPDGLVVLSRKNPAEAKRLVSVGSLHREFLHVICKKSLGIEDLTDIEGDTKMTVAVGPQGSGAWLIWENFIAEDDDYSKNPTSDNTGIDAVADVASGNAACSLIPAGLGNPGVREADENFGEEVVLAGANDKDFNDAKDSECNPLYEFMDIPSKTYKNLQGWFAGPNTVSWTAKLYLNTSRIDNPKVKTALIRAAARVKSTVQETYGR